jgi:D-alanyl-D-alanine carboxypeptidase/D-alanyl-D-alanine-endopeptidase (penicillin-binding protein 4)
MIARRAWPHILVLLCVGVGLRADAALLDRRLDAIFTDELLASAAVGVLVVETQIGKTLYERDADRALLPASNMKLVTSLAALRFLGADFRYRTALCAAQAPDAEGRIAGDLYVRGSGDPALTHEHLAEMAAALAEVGIRRITGDIVADASCFAGPPLGLGWPWNDETYAYSAQISGLGVDGNAVKAEVVGGSKPGEPCSLTLTPPSGYLTLDPECVTGAADAKRPTVFRRRAQNVVATTGPVPPGRRISGVVTLEEPDLYAARLLQRALEDRGIGVQGVCRRSIAPKTAEVLASHESAPLADLLTAMNVPSDNGIAEALLRSIPSAKGRPGTATEATGMIEGWLPEIGVRVQALRLCDGSGLSRLDLLTPRALVGVLRYAATHPERGGPLVASLPVAGSNGTLARRMKGTPAEGRIRAKTGSLWGASSLSGYVMDGQECVLTFSILMNNYRCDGAAARKLQDRACVAMVRHVVAGRRAEG